MPTNTIATNIVSVNQFVDGDYQLNVVLNSIDSILTLTTDQWIVGGQALAAFRMDNGLFCPGCIFNYATPLTQDRTSINGNPFKTINLNLSVNKLTTSQSSFSKYTYLYNLPLALDDDNKLVVNLVSGTILLTSLTMIGGNPIQIARIGTKWCIVLHVLSPLLLGTILVLGDGTVLDLGDGSLLDLS